MTAIDDFDRFVASWLESSGPADVREEVVDAALATARAADQRRGVTGWLVGADRWPAHGRRFSFEILHPVVRVATLLIVVALALVIVVAAITGAARPQRSQNLSVPQPSVVIPSDPLRPSSTKDGVIAYSISDIETRPYSHVHLVHADGSGDLEIAQGACPTFARDGRRLSYWSGFAETRELVIAAADGSSPEVVPFVKGRSAVATLSPDFTEVAWLKASGASVGAPGNGDRSNEVWVTPVAGGPGIRIAPKSSANESYSDLVWSPDGSRVAMAGMSDVASPGGSNLGSYRSSIYVADADGSHVQRLSARPGWDTVQLSWSPDGRYLAYDGTPDGSPLPSLGDDGSITSLYPALDVFVIGTDGTGERNLTNTPSTTERGPKWAPDGSRLAYYGPYTGGNAGWPVVTVQMADGRAVGEPVQGPPTDGFVWSPDGARLLLSYARDTSNGAQVQTFDGQIQSVDAGLQGAPFILLSVHHVIGCMSWQRLEP